MHVGGFSAVLLYVGVQPSVVKLENEPSVSIMNKKTYNDGTELDLRG